MTKALSFQDLIENKLTNRMNREDRQIEKMERAEAKAEKDVGELCREGKAVYYFFNAKGKMVEGSERGQVLAKAAKQYL